MAVTYDNTTAIWDSGTGSYTLAHTVGTGDNRVLVVFVEIDDSRTISGITYNGSAMTKAGSRVASNNDRLECWYLLSPDEGNNNVVVSFTNLSSSIGVSAISFFGSDGVENFTSQIDTNTLDVTSATDDMVVDCISNTLPTNPIPGLGQTERWDEDYRGSFNGSTKSGETTTTMSWSNIAGIKVQVAVNISAGTQILSDTSKFFQLF